MNDYARCHSASALVVSMLCFVAAGAAGLQQFEHRADGHSARRRRLVRRQLAGAGQYSGWQDSSAEIAQDGENLSGRWTLASTAGTDSATGDITGRVIGSAMAVGGTLETGTRLAGTYNTFSAVCPSGASVAIVLDRRQRSSIVMRHPTT